MQGYIYSRFKNREPVIALGFHQGGGALERERGGKDRERDRERDRDRERETKHWTLNRWAWLIKESVHMHHYYISIILWWHTHTKIPSSPVKTSPQSQCGKANIRGCMYAETDTCKTEEVGRDSRSTSARPSWIIDMHSHADTNLCGVHPRHLRGVNKI